MRAANLESLKEKIIRPDFDKHLVPLMLYRGPNNISAFGRMTRAWNFAVTMMESECETFSEAVKLASSPDFAHLCGPRRPLNHANLSSVFGRLRDNPNVTNNIPHLTEYVHSVRGPKHRLTPVSIYTNDPTRKNRNFAPWRINDYDPETKERMAVLSAHKLAEQIRKKETSDKSREERQREKLLTVRSKENIFYPYVIHKPNERAAEYDLMMEVNAAVPSYLPNHLRADICQDLIVAILSGELDRAELADKKGNFIRSVMRAHPMKYGPLSLDSALTSKLQNDSGDGGTTLLNLISPPREYW